MNKLKLFISKNWIKYTIFWSWNLVFLLTLVTVQIEEPFLLSVIGDMWEGLIPPSLVISSLIILIQPVISVVIGLKTLQNNPIKLINYFYGVQVPILLLCILRMTAFRELTLGTGVVIYSVIIAIGYYFFSIIKPSEKTNTVKMLINTLLAMAGIYVSLLLLFIAIPLISFFIRGLVEMLKYILENPLHFLQFTLVGFMFSIFFILSFTLFLIAPFAMIYYYLKSFFETYQAYKIENSKGYLVTGGFAFVFLTIIYFTSNNQPQQMAFKLADKTSYQQADKIAIIEEQNKVKAGLTNAYLAPYRYVDTWKGMKFIGHMYKEAFKLENNSETMQNIFNGLMYPFLYQDVKEANYDMKRAEELYENIFDSPIQKAESKAVKNALSATYDRDMAKAGVLNIDETKVLITSQEITVNETSSAAEVTLHERYLNQTFERLEIFYYFKLPENAAITGLWLSNDDSINKKFEYRVSPRGAAQKIYNQEVERRVDPSLLEQVGPHQYRLRAFPILPKQKEYKLRNKHTIVDGEPFHLWLKYVVLKTADNKIPSLKLLEKRNVYWSDETGRNYTNNLSWNNDDWMPTINGEKPFSALPKGISIAVDSNISLIINNEPKPTSKPLKLALLLDESYSMSKYKTQLTENLNYLKLLSQTTKYQIFASDDNNKMKPVNESELTQITYFGIQHPAQLLNNFSQTNTLSNYDAIIVLTDEGSNELDARKLPMLKSPKPIIICHFNGNEAPVYSDNLFESILASNGTAVTSLEQAILFLYKNNNTQEVIENNYLWKLNHQSFKLKSNDNKLITPIAAQKYIQLLMQQASGKALIENKNLDLIHKIAVKNSIVTPYSSMIVLVDEEQWKRLKEAEQSEDRFNRTNENGKDQLTKPFGFGLMEATGTPEPHEWVLIILAGLVLVYSRFQTKFMKNKI
ncbi:MAG: TIGR02921 family PEP-CTERM protein [Candidatus Methylacidiphilales bacterium]